MVAAACLATGFAAVPGASAQVLPPISVAPTTTAPTTTTTPSSTVPSSAAPKPPVTAPITPGGTPPIPKIVRQPVADPVFDQGVKVDRIQGLIIQAELALAESERRTTAVQKSAADQAAVAQRADRLARAADRVVGHWRSALADVAIGSYVSGPGGSLQATLRGDPRPVYRDLTLAQVRRNLLHAQRVASTRHGQAATARRAASRAKSDAADAVKLHAANTQKVAELVRQATAAQDRLTQLALGDRAISPEQARLLLAAALKRRGIDSYGVAPPVDPRVLTAIQFALDQQGKPYQWGGNGPNTFDCSGLTQQAFLRAGTTIPRVAADQQAYAVPVSADDAQPGDLVFFGTPATHVGMYLGNGNMVDAPYTGAVVRTEPVYRTSISGFGRIVFWS